MDIFLLIFVLVITGGAVWVNIKVLHHYQDPCDDGPRNKIAVKAVIVASLTLCWLMNILLPVDVRNSRPVPGLLDMRLIWNMAFITIAVFLMIIIPAAMFYYEAEGDVAIGKKVKRHVLCNMIFMLIFVGAALGISYAFLNKAAMPVREYRCPDTNWLDASATVKNSDLSGMVCGSATDSDIKFKVGFQVYLIAFMCFIGWFFFSTFGGVGLSALPVDLIIAFIDRPRPIDKETFIAEEREIGQIAMDLASEAEELKARDAKLSTESGWSASRKKGKLQADYNKWKKEVMCIEDDFEKLEVSHKEKGEHPLISYTKLLFGILAAIFSILWILHTILYVIVRQAHPEFSVVFLNGLFAAFEGPGLYPFGVAFFAAFNLYLLLCVVKGCLKVGMRIFMFMSIHPMKAQATPLNSILFNVLLVLISSSTVVQYSQQAFADYARLTDADVIFSAQIKYLEFYSVFFKHNVFLYVLLVWFILTIIYLFKFGPRDNEGRRKSKKKDKKGKKDKKDGKKDKKDDKNSKKDKKKDKKEKAPLRA